MATDRCSPVHSFPGAEGPLWVGWAMSGTNHCGAPCQRATARSPFGRGRRAARLPLRLRRRVHLPPASPPPRKRLCRPPLPPLLRKCLVIAGYRHRTVTLLYVGLAATGGILALLWTLDVAGSGLASGFEPTCVVLGAVGLRGP